MLLSDIFVSLKLWINPIWESRILIETFQKEEWKENWELSFLLNILVYQL